MSIEQLILPELVEALNKGMDVAVLQQMQHETVTYAISQQAPGRRLNDYYVEVRSMNGGFMDFYVNAARAYYGQEAEKSLAILAENDQKLQALAAMEFETDPYRIMAENKEARGLVDESKKEIGKVAESLNILKRFDLEKAKDIKDTLMKHMEHSPWLQMANNAHEAMKASHDHGNAPVGRRGLSR